MIRNHICLNSNPAGCEAVVQRQIAYIKKTFAGDRSRPERPRLALVVGCSTGYGLASRIAAAFGYGAATVGVSFEKSPTESKTGTPGFYNNRAFEQAASEEGLPGITLDGDAFSDGMKSRAIDALGEAAAKAGVSPQVDLFVYSLASPVRTDPRTGVLYRSVIKPIGKPCEGKSVDMMTGKISETRLEPAPEAEISATVKVMGGEDWELWMEALGKAGLLGPETRTVAYTYIGPELSWGIYRYGTIGRAKEDLERACRDINTRYGGTIAGAWVSVNKAVVTRASAVIPTIPLYVSCLFRVMKDRGLHEGCIEQIRRLYQERLYGPEGTVPVDEEGRIRLDDREMREDVQEAVLRLMDQVTGENVFQISDLEGFRHDFLEAHGFDVEGVEDEDHPVL